MSKRERARAIMIPLVTTFTGVGGLVFHVGHGPEHLVCMASAAMLAVGGMLWSFWIRFSQRRPKLMIPVRQEDTEGRYTMHITAPGVRNYRRPQE